MYPRSSPQTGSVVGGTTVTVAYPSSMQAGDLLIFAVAIAGNPTVGGDPTGFTNQSALASPTTSLTVRCYLRIADGTETGSASATWTGALNAVGAMAAFQGWSGSTIVVDPPAQFTTGAGTASYNRNAGASSSGGKQFAPFAVAAGVNTVGVDTIAAVASGSWYRVVEVAGGTTPFLVLDIYCAGTFQPATNWPNFATTGTRTTTALYVGALGVQFPTVTTYSNHDLSAAAAHLEALSPIFSTISGFPGSGAAWPTAGQGWPRLKQG